MKIPIRTKAETDIWTLLYHSTQGLSYGDELMRLQMIVVGCTYLQHFIMSLIPVALLSYGKTQISLPIE